MPLKVEKIVRPFDGTGDLGAWLRKFKMVVKLQKLGNLHEVLPLFLEGPAFACYEEMDPANQDDAVRIEEALLEAFSVNPHQAYDMFRQRNWQEGETVDVYLNELRRLARLADVESDKLLRRAFVVGLPSAVSAQLRTLCKVSDADLPTILGKARTLMEERVGEVALAVAPRSKTQSFRVGGSSSSTSQPKKNFSCFNCGEEGHMSRDCNKERKAVGAPKKQWSCYSCGEPGHIAKFCKVSGNDNGKLHARAISQDQQ
jgi:hypothetical protein